MTLLGQIVYFAIVFPLNRRERFALFVLRLLRIDTACVSYTGAQNESGKLCLRSTDAPIEDTAPIECAPLGRPFDIVDLEEAFNVNVEPGRN